METAATRLLQPIVLQLIPSSPELVLELEKECAVQTLSHSLMACNVSRS